MYESANQLAFPVVSANAVDKEAGAGLSSEAAAAVTGVTVMNEEYEDDEPTCPRCGGPIYSQPHWSYWKCDDCGYSEKKEEMDP